MTTITRANSFTKNNQKEDLFSDFFNSFTKTPVGDQLAKVSNERAINQSLKNLVKTNLGERLFQPYVGSNVYALLFENNTSEVLNTLELHIENTIRNNEPRVNLLQVIVNTSNNEYEIDVTIIYNIINNPDPISLSFILKRVR
jgi:phage baseplate assembly protein W